MACAMKSSGRQFPATLDSAVPEAIQEEAGTAYQDFLTLWKDADPDIPILIADKSEHAKLK